MKIVVASGEYREILKFKTDDRSRAHRLGCVEAVKSGKVLGQVICSSVHLQNPGVNDDDIFTLTSVVQAMLEAGKEQREKIGTACSEYRTMVNKFKLCPLKIFSGFFYTHSKNF